MGLPSNLALPHGPVGVANYFLWKWESCSKQEGRPVDGVEAQDVLPHNVSCSGPAVSRAWVPRHSQIVHKGIQPDINLWRERERQ